MFVKYSIYDIICDVIICCAWSCETGKINLYDNVELENQKKIENENHRNFYVNLYLFKIFQEWN